MRRLLFQVVWLTNLAVSLSLVGLHLHQAYGPRPEEGMPPKQTLKSVAMSKLSVADAVNHLAAKDAVFVDARPVEAYRAGSIPTAVSAPVGSPVPPSILGLLRKASLVIVYCDGPQCGAAEEQAEFLKSQGVLKSAILEEGWSGWTAAGLPEVKASGTR